MLPFFKSEQLKIPGNPFRIWVLFKDFLTVSEHSSLGCAETSKNLLRVKKGLARQASKAIADYGMIEEGDTILVCVSGGKDSYALLSILMALQKRAPIDFRLIAMNLDQKFPDFPEHVLPDYLSALGIEYRIVELNTYSIVRDKIPEGKTICALCSRLRRGMIYRTARELGANKVALGHHRDDIVHTLMLNLLFAGRLMTMPPKYVTNDKALVVIRPLAYCSEREIDRFVRGMAFPIIPANLCGAPGNQLRQRVREMMVDWDERYPGRTESVFAALQNVIPSRLADRILFDFKGLQTECARFAEKDDGITFSA